MAIFASTTLGSSDPQRAMSIKALEARAQALQAAQSKQEAPTSLPSPWQGAGYLANTLADTLATKRADTAAAQRRQDLAGYMANLGDNPTMAQVGPIMAADSDVGKSIMSEIQQRRMQAQQIQAQKDAAAEAAKTAETAAVSKFGREQSVPKTDLGGVTHDVTTGSLTPEEGQKAKDKLLQGSAAEQKLQGEEQTKNIELQSLLGSLNEAQQLAKDGVYAGPMSATKGFIGQHISAGGGPFGGVLGMDAKTSERTQRFNSIMSGPILQTLNSLKGASSDKELNFAIDTLNNADATHDNKLKALDTIMRKSDALQRASDLRLKQMGGTKVEVAPAAGAQPGAGGGGVKNVASEAEAEALPPGIKFKLPDGRTGVTQ